MPYTQTVREDLIFAATSVASTGDKGTWRPGKFPYYVRAAVGIATVAGSSTGVIKGDKRPTAGSDSGRGDGDVFVMNVPNPLAQGKALYKSGLNVRINPGEQVVIEVTTLVTGCSMDFLLFVEPVPETESNSTNMVAST